MGRAGVDLVEVMERIYQPADSLPAWHANVADALRPLLDADGIGIGGYRFDARDAAHPRLDDVFFAGAVAPEHPSDSHRALPPELVTRLYEGAPATSLSERGVTRSPEARRILDAVGLEDLVSIRVDEQPMRGWIVFSPRREVTTLAGPQRVVMERIARHVATARRLVTRPVDEAAAEAILTPDGRVEHATGATRAADAMGVLARAARRIERARGPMRRLDPHEAVAAWRALVDGQWSLVDHVDHDGRRYLFAVRNEPGAPRAPRLSKREREVCALVALGHANKLVAYELGLSTATVATHVASAMAKLGVSTRVELIARWNAVPRAAD